VCIFRELGARVRGEDQPAVELEHRDGTGRLRVVTFELRADDSS
jgi:hypothetical protein